MLNHEIDAGVLEASDISFANGACVPFRTYVSQMRGWGDKRTNQAYSGGFWKSPVITLVGKFEGQACYSVIPEAYPFSKWDMRGRTIEKVYEISPRELVARLIEIEKSNRGLFRAAQILSDAPLEVLEVCAARSGEVYGLLNKCVFNPRIARRMDDEKMIDRTVRTLVEKKRRADIPGLRDLVGELAKFPEQYRSAKSLGKLLELAVNLKPESFPDHFDVVSVNNAGRRYAIRAGIGK